MNVKGLLKSNQFPPPWNVTNLLFVQYGNGQKRLIDVPPNTMDQAHLITEIDIKKIGIS